MLLNYILPTVLSILTQNFAGNYCLEKTVAVAVVTVVVVDIVIIVVVVAVVVVVFVVVECYLPSCQQLNPFWSQVSCMPTFLVIIVQKKIAAVSL